MTPLYHAGPLDIFNYLVPLDQSFNVALQLDEIVGVVVLAIMEALVPCFISLRCIFDGVRR